MDDARIWEFEQSLWTGDAENYRSKISEHCVMVLPAHPHIYTAEQAVAAVVDTPRWDSATFSGERVTRPQYGLIVIGYHVDARRGDEQGYCAHCTTVMHLEGDHDWKVVAHQQTPKLAIGQGLSGVR